MPDRKAIFGVCAISASGSPEIAASYWSEIPVFLAAVTALLKTIWPIRSWPQPEEARPW